MGESHPKVVGLEDAAAFLDQVFELLDRKDFNPSEDEIMAVEHESKPIFGIQYHPESFATEGGKKIILNFLKLT